MKSEKFSTIKSEKISTNEKRGYLYEDFQLFHLKDRKSMQFEYHYHDFSKVIVFISGKVTYLIEGKSYRLKPWDILLVSSREVHKPIIDSGETYERIVIWTNPAFLEKHSSSDCNLEQCFEYASANKHNLLRPDPEQIKNVRHILFQLEAACKSNDFGNRILKNSLFMQFIVHLNRQVLEMPDDSHIADIDYDEGIEHVLSYINQNLSGDLSIDSLSEKFYTSKYHLMRKFKIYTGYSIHGYIIQKRLIMASMLIKSGKPSTETSIECGFADYSSFVRAFKKMFGLSPKQYYKNWLQLQNAHADRGHF